MGVFGWNLGNRNRTKTSPMRLMIPLDLLHSSPASALATASDATQLSAFTVTNADATQKDLLTHEEVVYHLYLLIIK